MTAPLDQARDILRRTFGHADFRGLQSEVIAEVLAGRDALAVLPTGGGKSVCYQIPALLRPGVGLVVSPLIALMSDQVEALRATGRRGGADGFRARAEERDDDMAAAGRRRARPDLSIAPEGLMQGGSSTGCAPSRSP